MYCIFLDDCRDPGWVYPDDLHVWSICRNFDDVKNLVMIFGIPNVISFDHDLGDNEPTGFDVAKWIVEGDLNGDHKIPQDFVYRVHSSNPVGCENIEYLLNNYLEFKKNI